MHREACISRIRPKMKLKSHHEKPLVPCTCVCVSAPFSRTIVMSDSRNSCTRPGQMPSNLCAFAGPVPSSAGSTCKQARTRVSSVHASLRALRCLWRWCLAALFAKGRTECTFSIGPPPPLAGKCRRISFAGVVMVREHMNTHKTGVESRFGWHKPCHPG